MSGYNTMAWKSNNAIAAENGGLMAASAAAKHLAANGFAGCTAADVAAIFREREWHHTSCWYNTTHYYDVVGDLIEDDATGVDRLEARLRAQIIERKSAAKLPEEIYTGVRVTWLEWSGSRNHPHATERVEDNCAVIVVAGKTMLTIVSPANWELRKKSGTRGLAFMKNVAGKFLGFEP